MWLYCPLSLKYIFKSRTAGPFDNLGLFFLKRHSFLTLLHYFRFLHAMSEDSDCVRPSASLADTGDGKDYLTVLLIFISSVAVKAGA